MSISTLQYFTASSLALSHLWIFDDDDKRCQKETDHLLDWSFPGYSVACKGLEVPCRRLQYVLESERGSVTVASDRASSCRVAVSGH